MATRFVRKVNLPPWTDRYSIRAASHLPSRRFHWAYRRIAEFVKLCRPNEFAHQERCAVRKLTDYILTAQAAEILGVSQNTLRAWARDGKISVRRKPIERYARRVKMKEIEANEFNLNISRYVSTAEAEQEIDLAATHRELVEIEKAIRKATAKHNEFLKELGLPPSPGA